MGEIFKALQKLEVDLCIYDAAILRYEEMDNTLLLSATILALL